MLVRHMDGDGQHAVDGEQSCGASPPPIASRFVLLAVVLAMTAFTSSVRVVTSIRDRQGQPRMQIQRTPNIGHRECGARLTGVNEAALCERTFSLEELVLTHRDLQR